MRSSLVGQRGIEADRLPLTTTGLALIYSLRTGLGLGNVEHLWCGSTSSGIHSKISNRGFDKLSPSVRYSIVPKQIALSINPKPLREEQRPRIYLSTRRSKMHQTEKKCGKPKQARNNPPITSFLIFNFSFLIKKGSPMTFHRETLITI